MIGPDPSGGLGPGPGPYFVEWSDSTRAFEIIGDDAAIKTNLAAFVKGIPRDVRPLARFTSYEAAVQFVLALRFLRDLQAQ